MSAPNRIRVVPISALLLLCFTIPAFALRADELLLIVNENVPESRELAEFYTAARLVPAGRILSLKLTNDEQMTFEAYERDVVVPIRKFLRDNKLESQVKCLVMFYGVPLRIAGRIATLEDKRELDTVRKQLVETRASLDVAIGEVEAIAKSLDPNFRPHTGVGLEDAARRADVSIRAGLIAMSEIPDAAQQRETAGKLVALLQRLGGSERVAELLQKSPALSNLLPAMQTATSRETAAALEQLVALQEQRHDAAARKTLRESVSGTFGLFGATRTLQAQVDYLDNDGTSAAVDNELSLLWWNLYPRSKWQTNPLFFKSGPRAPGSPRVMMTARLDAPKPDTVRQIILGSLRAERDGLSGKVVVDSRGIQVRENNGKPNGFGMYDQTLRDFSDLVRTKTTLPLNSDDRDPIFGPNAETDVALYAGWYSLRNYVPSFTFATGAVGFHIASFEMISLKMPHESGWVANLLNNGVVATLGPVAEPYLQAFPAADEFFPLLMTGKLTLAEVYWRTTPMTSWMMSMVGDPLYRPFAKNPPLGVEDLPDDLRRATPIGGEPTSAPATLPATGPATSPVSVR